MSGSNDVEIVRGRIDGELAAELERFWSGLPAPGPGAPPRSSGEVVCVLRSPEGALAGTASAAPRQLAMVGNRTFWAFEAALAEPAGDEDFFAVLAACFGNLAEEFAATSEGPVGVALLVSDGEFLGRNPEAIWPRVGFLHAGFAPDGSQLRLRYFEDARI
jgi:hypothetical protein